MRTDPKDLPHLPGPTRWARSSFLCCFVLTLFTAQLDLSSQTRDLSKLRFQELTPEDNSPLIQINDIIQGPDGFIWIASSTGALRYNGYEIQAFVKKADDPSSLLNDAVWNGFLDSQNRLWLGTERGVSRYLPKTESFANYSLLSGTAAQKRSTRCNAIVENEKGQIFASTEKGVIFLYDPEDDTFIPLNDNNRLGIIKSMAADPSGTLWVGSDNSVHLVDPSTLDVQTYTDGFETPPGTPANFIYQTRYVDAQQIWFGTAYNGLVTLNPKTGKTKQVTEPNHKENRIHGLEHYGENYMWACHRDGISLFDTKTLKKVNIQSASSKTDSLPAGSMTSILVDDQENIWVGTYKQGLFVSTNNKPFEVIVPDVSNFDPGLKPVTTSLMLDTQDRLWKGFAAGGISVTHRDGRSAFDLPPDSQNPQSIGEHAVYDIVQTSDGSIWIACYNDGLIRYDEATKSIKRYRHDPSDPHSIGGNDIRGIAEDSSGRLWLSYKGAGFGWFDPTTEKAESFMPNLEDRDNSLLNRWTSDIIISKDEIVYVATPTGVTTFDPKTKSFRNFQSNPNDPSSLSHPYCIDLFEDKSGDIWIGTRNGINRLDTKNHTITRYQTNDGMPGNQTLVINDDLNGNIWAGTDNGLARINPETGRIKSYDKMDGLADNAFLSDSTQRAPDGTLYFGQKRGITCFVPSEIKENTTPPPVFISDARIYFNSLKNVYAKQGDPLPIFYPKVSSMTLGYDAKAISFEYVAKNFIQPSKNQYAYKLEGFDTKWVYAGNRREANYTNLPPGKYTFKVKAANNDGYWNEKGQQLALTITPPFWKRPTFYAGLMLASALSLIAFIRFRERLLKQEREKLEELVEKRTRTISKQKAKLELQKNELASHQRILEEEVKARTAEYLAAKLRAEESDRLKSSFLANLSHEIRTPLNAVVGFSNLLRTTSERDRDEYVDIIDDNSKSLLRLIDDILDFSMIESNQVTMFEEEFSFNEFFGSIAQAHSINFESGNVSFVSENSVFTYQYTIKSDRQRIKQVIDNLLTNAYKFTESGTVELKAETIGETLVISVSDTGKGISEENVKRIFDHFYRIQEDEILAKRGVGLGLAICKRLAQLLGGDLSVKSKLGLGSCFSLELPMKKITPKKKEHKPADFSKETSLLREFTGNRILIIEDEENNRSFLQTALSKYKVETVSAIEGRSGIEKFRTEGPFHMVLLDIKMPELDGFAVQEKLRKIDPDAIIVAQTAHTMKGDELKIRQAGFTDYLSKPISLAKLDHVLHKYLS